MADRKEEKSQYRAEYYVNNREEILRKQLSTMRTTAKKFFGRKTNAMRTIVKNGLCTTMLTVKKFCGKKPSTVRTINEQDRARYARNREEILRKKAELRRPPKPKKPPKFKYQAAFNKRVREEKRYYCEVCDTAFSKPNELKRHFETKKHARNSQAPK